MLKEAIRNIKNLFLNQSKTNLDNKIINVVIAPVYFWIIYGILRTKFFIPAFNHDHFLKGAVAMSTISTLFYCYCSYFFQPDLDHHENRPGRTSFPLGHYLMKKTFFRVLMWPINRAWYYAWYWLAILFTHRGVPHWPIIGTALRVSYIYLWLLFGVGVCDMMGWRYPEWFFIVKSWCWAFYPFSKDFGSVLFYTYCLPVLVSDFFHIGFDLIDSIRKGTPFCQSVYSQGIFISMYRKAKGVKNLIKDFSKHD